MDLSSHTVTPSSALPINTTLSSSVTPLLKSVSSLKEENLLFIQRGLQRGIRSHHDVSTNQNQDFNFFNNKIYLK